MKKQLSYKELQNFDNAATLYLIKNGYFTNAVSETETTPAKPAGFTTKPNTKFSANLRKVINQAAQHFKEYSEAIDDLQIKYCAVDEKTKTILLDDKGNRKFTIEGHQSLKKAIKELSNEKVEINTRITEGDWDLTDEEKQAFNGIVIPEFETDEE